MEARHRISPTRPLELFPANRSTIPSWETLPAHTRRAVLGRRRSGALIDEARCRFNARAGSTEKGSTARRTRR